MAAWEGGRGSGCAVQPLLTSPIAEDHAGGPSPALRPPLGAQECWYGHMHATGAWLLTLLLAQASSRGLGCQRLELVMVGALPEAGVSLGTPAPKVAPVAWPSLHMCQRWMARISP